MSDTASTNDADATTDGADAADPSPELPSRYGCPLTETHGQQVIHVPRAAWLDVASQILRDGYRMCIDLTAVDYLTHDGRRSLPAGIEPERFEVVASFINHDTRQRLRARVQVPVDDPVLRSLYVLYPGSDYLEREVFDMFGIRFEGHPDLSRILMPETWQGHPLRKDYATGTIPVQFKGTK